MYAGSWAGLWRSRDAGETWSQLTWPQPTLAVQGEIAGALYAPHVFDLAASPADANLVLVSALDSQYVDGRDGIYRTNDGGANWTLVFKSAEACNIVFAPDDANLVYAVTTTATKTNPPQNIGVLAISRDAGATWKRKFFGNQNPLWHVAVGPLEPDGKRRVYAVGNSVVWYSTDAGQTWNMDLGVTRQINNVRQVLAMFQASCGGNGVGNFGGAIAFGSGDAPQILAVDPSNPAKVFLATTGGALGPTYYHDKVPDGTLVNTDCRRLAGEASLWVRRLQPIRVEQQASAMGIATRSSSVFGRDHAERQLLCRGQNDEQWISVVLFRQQPRARVAGNSDRQRIMAPVGRHGCLCRAQIRSARQPSVHARGSTCDRVHAGLRDHVETIEPGQSLQQEQRARQTHRRTIVDGERRRCVLLR